MPRIKNEKDQKDYEVLSLNGSRRPSCPSIGSLVVSVQGAGVLEFRQGQMLCANAVGVGVSCSWSNYGYSGGVMDKSEVKELVKFLTDYLNGDLEIIEPAKAGA